MRSSDGRFEIIETLGGWAVKKYLGSAETFVVVPHYIDSKKILEIQAPAFQSCDFVEIVEVENGVETICSCAFNGSKNLQRVIIPDSVTKIGDYAFAVCPMLNCVSLGNGVQIIGNGAFSSCAALKEIEFPHSLERIEWSAFFNCTSLINVAIPFGTIYIGDEAFGECALKSIYIPETVKISDAEGYRIFYNSDTKKCRCFSDPEFTIFCHSSSDAERMAILCGLKYSLMDGNSGIETNSVRVPQFLSENQDVIIAELKKYFTRNITIPETQDVSYHFISFQYDPAAAKLILERELGIKPEIVSITDDTNYILGIRYGKKEYNYPLFEIENVFHQCNIPYITLSCNHKGFNTFQYNSGLPDKVNAGYYYRADLGLSLRSTWEANIARILRYLGIIFEYEKSGFPRYPVSKQLNDPEADVTGYYFPDFFLPENRIIEVKGNWDLDSRRKVQEFAANYPQYQYSVIDADMYFTLQQKYSPKIPLWERTKERHSGSTTLQVVGINYGRRKTTISNLQLGQDIKLVRDRDNPYDKNAIKACTLDGEEIGFLSADWAYIYAQKMDIGMEYTATVREIMPSKINIEAIRSNPDKEILFDFLREKE